MTTVVKTKYATPKLRMILEGHDNMCLKLR